MKFSMKPSRLIGPEDVRPGIFVTVSHETFQFIPNENGGLDGGHIEPAHVTVIPCDAGQPLLVKNVCLPFVLVTDPKGSCYSLDLRRARLARLSTGFGKEAFTRMSNVSASSE